MTREDRIREVIAALDPVGDGEDTNIAHVFDSPERFLLVEQNVGRAAYMQSHYLTTHDTLEDAGLYHAGQEYAEDWMILYALDLETGVRHEAAMRVVWTPAEPVMVQADYEGETWMVHGYEWVQGEENRAVTVLKQSPKDRRRSTYDWLHAPTADLENVKWSTEVIA